MKSIIYGLSKHLFYAWLLILCACFWVMPTARAGLTVDIHLYHDTFGYYFYPYLSANTNTPNFPNGYYEITSPQYPTNNSLGSQLQYQATNNTIGYATGGGNYYYDFNSFLFGITNGQWSIFVTNSISTNQYKFTVTVTGVTSNSFGAPAVAVFPTNGAMNVTSQPLFSWTGPANWAGSLSVQDYYIDTNGNYNYEAAAGLPPDQTSWPCPVVLPDGTNDFSVDYTSNVTAQIIAATPTNNAAQPISGWISTATLESDFTYDPQFTVGTPVLGGSGGHTLVAHYDFDNNGNLGEDISGNGNDMSGETWWGPQHQSSTDAEVGGGAIQFFGTDAINPYNQAVTNLNAVLAGSFTFSVWVKTTVTNGADYNNAFFGAVIFWAYNDQQGNTNDTIPLAITGSKAAFTTRGGDPGASDTLHSITSVNDGNYHLITVTRDQTTGEKKIYVDGNFEDSQIGTTNPLNGNNYNLTIGGWAYEIDTAPTNYSAYSGLLDDLQIYSGVLSDTEVATLYGSPGTTIPNLAGSAANGLAAYYDFDEGSVVAPDVSGNGNNIVLAGNFGGSGPAISSDTIAGVGSVSFDGGSYLTAPTNLLSTLAGNFSISIWVNTTQDNHDPDDYAFNGAGIISADVGGLANDLVPIALTGGQIAFNTGDTDYGYDDTINSSATVNDGNWHHVVVSRNQTTGEKDIYIDGVLDTSDFDTTELLNDPQLLTIGAIADASNPDPSSPDDSGYNGYDGLLDDIQIYDRVLSPDEVSFLYNNPGTTLASFSSTPYPVDVDLQFVIYRSQDPNFGEYYSAGVSFNSVNPAPTTTNSVQSPNNYFNAETYPSGGSSSSAILGSLSDVINEFTNGSWIISINQGSPTQQVYSFQVSISGLDTNLLKAVKVFYPTNGSVNVSTNPVYYWTGLTNYSTLVVDLLSGPYASLPITATNWLSAPILSYGSNRFDVNYTSNNFPGVTFTTPADASSNPVRTWATTVNLASESFNNFVVGAPAPLPVLLTNLTRVSGNLQFSFQTLAGRPHTIQSRTNLTHGAWINLTNFTGDGSLKQFTFPATNPPVQFFRVNTQ
ncbi:MAG TPA: LamG domain-containing protein [Verrucomicrobiae bacterium]